MLEIFDKSIADPNKENLLEFLINILQSSTEDAMVGNNIQGNIILWNKGAEKLYGYKPHEVLGKPYTLFFPEDIKSGTFSKMINTATTEGKWAGYVTLVRKGGQTFTPYVTITPVYDIKNQINGFLVISKNNETDQNTKQDNIFNLNTQLDDLSSLKNIFYSMGHELRTPLNVIIGYLEIVLMKLPGPLTQEQESQLEVVQRNAKNLLILINQLLDISKIEQKKYLANIEAISFQTVIEEVVASLRSSAAAKNIAIHVEAPKVPFIIQSDRLILIQLLTNLIKNAITYTKEGFVSINLSRQTIDNKNYAILDIIDTGIGIKPEDQVNLFQAFYQVEKNPDVESTGLGLYISKKLSELINHEIEFESEFEKGSRFTLKIPI